MLVAAGAGFEIAGSVHDNALDDLIIERETIVSGQNGLVLAGSLASSLALGGDFFAGGIEFPGYRQPGEERGNMLSGVVVRDSTITAPNGINLSGGNMSATEDVMSNSALGDVTLESLVLTSETTPLVLLGGVVVGSGEVRECTIDRSPVARAARLRGTAHPPPIVLDQVVTDGAPESSVSGNRILHVEEV